MKSAVPKVLHPAAGLPLIEHVLRTADTINPASVILIVGHQADAVQAALTSRAGVRFALQEPQLGTGHALLQAEAALTGATGTVVLLSGDVPLLRPQTLEALVRQHQASGAAATVLTALMDDPSGYGRIERHDGRIAAIVEHKDANADQRAIKEINSGIYAFDVAPLFDALRQIGSANAQGEHYLPDLVRIYRERGLPVETVVLEDAREIMGVNSRAELAQVAEVLRMSKNEALMAAGVTIVDPATAYIGADVTIGPDTTIHPNVQLEGRTRIGSGCDIQSGVRIVNSTLADNVFINNHCLVVDSTIGRGARLGPFAHIRPESNVGEDAHIGNFVELKKTTLGTGLQGEPPRLSRRRRGRRKGQRRRRHDHLQLRRHRQAPDHDRGRRLHRQRLAADRARHRGPRRLRRGRLLDHRRRAGRIAGDRARQAGEQRGLGREEQEAEGLARRPLDHASRGRHVRNYRIYRPETARSHSH